MLNGEVIWQASDSSLTKELHDQSISLHLWINISIPIFIDKFVHYNSINCSLGHLVNFFWFKSGHKPMTIPGLFKINFKPEYPFTNFCIFQLYSVEKLFRKGSGGGSFY